MIGGVCKIFIKSRSFVANLTVTNWHLTHRKAFNWIFVIFSVWQSGNYKYGETPVFWYCRLVHQSSNTLFFCLSLSFSLNHVQFMVMCDMLILAYCLFLLLEFCISVAIVATIQMRLKLKVYVHLMQKHANFGKLILSNR